MKNLILFLIISASANNALAQASDKFTDWPFDIQIQAKKDYLKYSGAVAQAKLIMQNHFIGEPKHPVKFTMAYIDPKECHAAKNTRKWNQVRSDCISLAVCYGDVETGNKRNRIRFYVGRAPHKSESEWVITAIHELLHCWYGIDHMAGTLMNPTTAHDRYFMNAYKGNLSPFIKEIEVHYYRGTAPFFMRRPSAR